MRPKRWTYTIVAASLTGYASNATGATWTLTATTPGDGLAHPVTIKNDSATDHSGKTTIITGTGAEGQAQTETLNLPGTSATVTSLKYFKTVTSVVPSATIGADTMDIGWTAAGVTPLIPLCFAVHGTAEIQTTLGGTTMNYTPQQTIWPLDAATLALTSTIASNKVFTTLAAAGTADLVTAPSEGATAARILINSHTSGVLNIAVAQPRD
jgi:hypothetical protein